MHSWYPIAEPSWNIVQKDMQRKSKVHVTNYIIYHLTCGKRQTRLKTNCTGTAECGSHFTAIDVERIKTSTIKLKLIYSAIFSDKCLISYSYNDAWFEFNSIIIITVIAFIFFTTLHSDDVDMYEILVSCKNKEVIYYRRSLTHV